MAGTAQALQGNCPGSIFISKPIFYQVSDEADLLVAGPRRTAMAAP